MYPSAVSAQAGQLEIMPELAIPTISPATLRVVPPIPRVTVTDESGQQRRQPTSSRGASATPRSTSTSSSPAGSRSGGGGLVRAPGIERDPDDPREYGRLIVITSDEGVTVMIEGQPYPNNEMTGVLLIANEQYEVFIGSSEASSGSEGPVQGRTITLRLSPGETRVLMANPGGGTATRSRSTPTRASSSRRSSRRSRDNDDDDDDDTGYLGVSSSPRGTVYVDGENTGSTTPARRIQLEPGRHEVRIFYDSLDRFSETKNVLIRAGVNTNVFFRARRDEDEAREAAD
jgi:hypothetical protein